MWTVWRAEANRAPWQAGPWPTAYTATDWEYEIHPMWAYEPWWAVVI